MMFLKRSSVNASKELNMTLDRKQWERSPENYAFSVQKSRRGAFKSRQESSEDKTDDDDETEDLTDNSSPSDEDETLAKIRPLNAKSRRQHFKEKVTLISVHRIFFFFFTPLRIPLQSTPPGLSPSSKFLLSAHFILRSPLPKLQTNPHKSKFNTSAFNTCILNYFTFQKAAIYTAKNKIKIS